MMGDAREQRTGGDRHHPSGLLSLRATWSTDEPIEPLAWVDPFCTLDSSMRGTVEPTPLVIGPEAIHWFQLVVERCEMNAKRDICRTMADQIAEELDELVLAELEALA